MVFVPLSNSIPTGNGDNSQEAPEACKRVFEQWDSLGMPRSEKTATWTTNITASTFTA
ncbi:glutamate--cysteine ligase [Neisseria gonorrhoeae]|uniref:Glutamate--cysteine ligase n=1 Tax=Neisseria gonorrhoeae TaxID=485 RepID=A0A378VXW5_NEIGO|nr:glutamate--cysteine ligase [Neisseria gonorrhoeae]